MVKPELIVAILNTRYKNTVKALSTFFVLNAFCFSTNAQSDPIYLQTTAVELEEVDSDIRRI